jgi:hypothetical protein
MNDNSAEKDRHGDFSFSIDDQERIGTGTGSLFKIKGSVVGSRNQNHIYPSF